MYKKNIIPTLLILILLNFNFVNAEDYRTIQTMDNTDFITSMPSYIGVLNKKYTGDNGTRFYILPENKTETGAGGTLKIFADPYHLQTASGTFNYRDLGLYFHQDQKGDKGTNGTGVFWINGKVAGEYWGKNPDIGFGFQDGATVSARMSYFQENGIPRSLLTVGEGLPKIRNAKTVKLEMHGDLAFRNNDMLRWVSSSGYADSGIRLEKDNSFNFISRGFSIFKAKNNADKTNQVKFNASVAMGTTSISNPTTLNVKNSNIFTINNSQKTLVNSIVDGTEGQEITLIFNNGQTIIENNTTIKLKDTKNFDATANDTLKLIYNGTAWYEISRSLN